MPPSSQPASQPASCTHHRRHCAVPAHKFGFALPWLEEFASPRWKAYAEYIRKYPAPAKGDEEGTNFAALRGNMLDKVDSACARAAVIAGWDLCAPAVRLLQDASKDARIIPMDFWPRFSAWTNVMQGDHSDVNAYVRRLALDDVKLDPEGRRMLCTNIERAIASAFDKTYAHLAEDATIVDADGCATKVRTELEIYARRAWWNIGQPGVMPSPSDYRAVTTWEVRALGRDASTSFKLAYHAFWGRREANALPRRVPPPPAEPFSLADAKELLEFWRAIATGPSDSAPVGVAALRALTIPI